MSMSGIDALPIVLPYAPSTGIFLLAEDSPIKTELLDRRLPSRIIRQTWNPTRTRIVAGTVQVANCRSRFETCITAF